MVVFGNMMEGEPEPQDLEMHEESDEDKKPQDKKGRKKIKIELIEEKSRRHITFSKRKLGIMKKVRPSRIRTALLHWGKARQLATNTQPSL